MNLEFWINFGKCWSCFLVLVIIVLGLLLYSIIKEEEQEEEEENLEWINENYRLLVDNKDISKLEREIPDGGSISIYRVDDIIRIDMKLPEKN